MMHGEASAKEELIKLLGQELYEKMEKFDFNKLRTEKVRKVTEDHTLQHLLNKKLR